MSRKQPEKKRRGRGKQERKKVVLVFGESENDTKSIRELIVSLCPELDGLVETRRRPLVLIKDAPPDKVPERARQIADAVADTQDERDVECVFVHEDCDAVEPAHEEVCRKLEQALEEQGCPAHAAVAAWELEAWWFLWPEAVKAVRSSWRAPTQYKNKNVGKIRNAKEELKRCVVPPGLSSQQRKNFPDYQESDSPLVASKVRELKLARSPRAKSDSYWRFMSRVARCGEKIKGL